MQKSEVEFIRELEKKAKEERRLVESELMPSWAKGLGEWLVVNPWRVLVPMAGMTYLLCRVVFGQRWTQLTLAIFGGFR